MNIFNVQAALDDVGIDNYPDGCNPTTQLHFDYKNRAFYFEQMLNENVWELYEIGHTTMHGIVSTQVQLISLLARI